MSRRSYTSALNVYLLVTTVKATKVGVFFLNIYLLQTTQLSRAHRKPSSDVDHDVRVPSMLGLHGGVLK